VLTADHNETDKLTREFERRARLRTEGKNMQSRLLPSSTISCARMRKE
jgi:hypothetical protein